MTYPLLFLYMHAASIPVKLVCQQAQPYLFIQNLKETEKLINDEKLVYCNVELSIIMQKALGRGNKSYTFRKL